MSPSDYDTHFRFVAECREGCDFCELGYRVESVVPLDEELAARRDALIKSQQPLGEA